MCVAVVENAQNAIPSWATAVNATVRAYARNAMVPGTVGIVAEAENVHHARAAENVFIAMVRDVNTAIIQGTALCVTAGANVAIVTAWVYVRHVMVMACAPNVRAQRNASYVVAVADAITVVARGS